MTRPAQRAMMLYVDAGTFDAIRKLGLEQHPLPVKPGPMAAYILRKYFDEKNGKKAK